MPSKRKGASRAGQIHPQAILSDYDTDTAGYTDHGAVTAPFQAPPARTNTELNLAVLRRYSPNISHIQAIAPFAVVYLFSPESQQWEKCGIEGTLFVCQLSGAALPRYEVVILNRKSLDNFITELTSGEDVEITNEYVILQVLSADGVPNIYGLWIFSDGDSVPTTREVVAMSIQECAVRAGHNGVPDNSGGHVNAAQLNMDGASDYEEPHPSIVTQPTRAPHPGDTGRQIDLLSLFNKPQIQNETHIQQAPHPAHYQAYSQQQFPFAPTGNANFFRT